MLSPPDADLVQRDRNLPGLATLLDPEAFAAALQPFVPEANAAAVHMTYARYKPSKSCVVGYRLDVDGVAVDLYGKAHPNGARDVLRQERERSNVPERRPGRFILEDGAITVSVFPSDAKLKPLRRFAGAEACHRLLRKLVPDRPDLWEGTVRSLRYMPERRYVAQLLTNGTAAGILKVYAEPGYPMAQGNAKAFRSHGPLRVARWLGQSDRYRILMSEWLVGRLASEAILDPEFETSTLMTIGAALAQMHAQESEGLACLTRRHETATLFALCANLGCLCPHLAGRLAQLVRRLAAELEQAPPVTQSIHGDFCAKQVLVTDKSAAIVDLDRAVRGDPATDIGLFIAHLERDALFGLLSVGRLERLQEALLEGYRTVTRHRIPLRVPLYIAVGMLRLAADPFRFREPRWRERTTAIVERAEALTNAAAEKHPHEFPRITL